MLEVRRWAEIRRMKEVEGLSIHEIARCTGHDRNTVRRALRREGPRKVGPSDGHYAELGGCDGRFLIWGEESGGGFSLVEHPIPPRSLCAPLHRHDGVDEYSFVLEARMGALLGDQVVYVEAGELAFKPRDQWHTFWNAGDEPCRVLEIISPAGFEHFFREWDAGTKDGTLDPEALGVRYGVEFERGSVPRLCAEHGLVHPLLG